MKRRPPLVEEVRDGGRPHCAMDVEPEDEPDRVLVLGRPGHETDRLVEAVALAARQNPAGRPVQFEGLTRKAERRPAARTSPRQRLAPQPRPAAIRQLAAVLGRHDAFHALEQVHGGRAVVFERFGAVPDRNARLPAQKLVMRGLVRILIAPPSTDIEDQDGRERRASITSCKRSFSPSRRRMVRPLLASSTYVRMISSPSRAA